MALPDVDPLTQENMDFADKLLRTYGFPPGSREYEGFIDTVFLLCDGRLLDDALGKSGFTRDDVSSWTKLEPKIDSLLKRASARGNYSDSERFEIADTNEAHKLQMKRRYKESQTWFSTRPNSGPQQNGETLDSLFGGDD
jgi:hypothetical protein